MIILLAFAFPVSLLYDMVDVEIANNKATVLSSQNDDRVLSHRGYMDIYGNIFIAKSTNFFHLISRFQSISELR